MVQNKWVNHNTVENGEKMKDYWSLNDNRLFKSEQVNLSKYQLLLLLLLLLYPLENKLNF